MANTFRNEGIRVFLWDYQSKKQTIEGHAQHLVEDLQKIAAAHPGEPIHFATHSFGGIIVRAAVNHPDCPPEARMGRAVLLAPPNQGAQLGLRFRRCPAVRWFFGNRAGRQLLTYDHEAMSRIGQFPKTMDVMVIAGRKGTRFYKAIAEEGREPSNDGKVAVEETYLDTPHRHYTLDVGHSWIMTSRQSISLTRSFILNIPLSH